MNITADTRTLGLLGCPVSHSKSPEMINEACQRLDVPAVYLAYQVEPELLEKTIAGLRALGFMGFNVTIPHKIAIIPYLDEIDHTAREIGAVNTVVHQDGRLIGYNTDGIGYLRSLQEEQKIVMEEQTVTILGAGGAARAVSIILAKAGVKEIIIANRTVEKAEELAQVARQWTEVSAVPISDSKANIARSTLLINTTSVGMIPHVEETPIPVDYLHPKLIVSDLVYRPRETKFLEAAQQIGAKTHNGLGMLLHQAAVAVELWFDRPAPIAQMRAILEKEDSTWT
jgi:shikimate dehydrogenase